ncbi:MAG TPA: nuclear transport factor 2 family protein [Pyrinomonadaceae bacterium]|nr:nuclear transport factor 2 family protein [Pyrinomonadaceae bacterium]
MKRILAVALLALAAYFPAQVSASFRANTSSVARSSSRARVQAPDAEFKLLLEQFYAAWSTLNADNAARFYARDADLIFFDIAPLEYHGWEEYRTGFKQVAEQFSSLKLASNNDLKVTRRGNIAWTTSTFHVTGAQKNGQAVDLTCRHTLIWERRGRRWLIVHEHVSVPLPS